MANTTTRWKVQAAKLATPRCSLARSNWLSYSKMLINSTLSSSLSCSKFSKPDGRRRSSLKKRSNTAISTTSSLKMLPRRRCVWRSLQTHQRRRIRSRLLKIVKLSTASNARRKSMRLCSSATPTRERLATRAKRWSRSVLRSRSRGR